MQLEQAERESQARKWWQRQQQLGEWRVEQESEEQRNPPRASALGFKTAERRPRPLLPRGLIGESALAPHSQVRWLKLAEPAQGIGPGFQDR